MRVGLIALQHESNTFIATPTTVEDFQRDVLAVGEQVRQTFGPAHHEMGGFFEGLERQHIEAVPLFAARAMPSGVIRAQALQELLTMMFQQLDAAGPLDGLLVAPHGAAVSQDHRDMDGYWLGRLREHVGLNLPILCTLDPHGNLSDTMVRACNAMIAYRSNPHLDQRQRGLEAAGLMARTLRGEVRPTQAAAFPPIAINIERQYTNAPPCLPLYDMADRMLQQPKVLSNSVMLGFPYADVREMGSAFIVVTDDELDLARELAEDLAGYLFAHRREFVAQLVNVQEALERTEHAPGPACLLDMGDNVGGGSPADGTWIAQEILRRKSLQAFVCLCDPQAADQARQTGVGHRVKLAMGGKVDPRHGLPLVAEVTVLSLHDGRFIETKPRHGGATVFHMGPTAVVRTDHGLTIQLTSRRIAPFSLNQLTSCGIDPRDFQVLIAKGVQAPVAAYEAVCPTIIRVNTPGVTTADMLSLEYQHRRRPLFPFEPIDRP